MTVHGRVAVVTGGTRGLGLAITERLAREGVTVVAVWHSDEQAAAELMERSAAHGWAVTTRRCDIQDPTACEALSAAIADEIAVPDYLVCNAGIMLDGPIETLSIDDWDAVIRVDLSAAFYLTRCFFPQMVAKGFGRVVMIGSSAGTTGSPARPNYAAAKAGLVGLTRSLARGAQNMSVTANLIVVGPTEAGMGTTQSAAALAALTGRMPIGRLVKPEEVAHAVRYLVDEMAGAVTGSTLFVDGGITI